MTSPDVTVGLIHIFSPNLTMVLGGGLYSRFLKINKVSPQEIRNWAESGFDRFSTLALSALSHDMVYILVPCL